MQEISRLTPEEAQAEMQRLLDTSKNWNGTRHWMNEGELVEAVDIMAGLLVSMAEVGFIPSVDGPRIRRVIREWELRDELVRCPECREPVRDEDGPDGAVVRECVSGCGYREVL